MYNDEPNFKLPFLKKGNYYYKAVEPGISGEAILNMVRVFIDTKTPFGLRNTDSDKLRSLVESFYLELYKDRVMFVAFEMQEDGMIDLENPVGFIAGCRSSTHGFLNDSYAIELGWYVTNHNAVGVGMNLLKAFEDWAKAVGCDKVIITSFNDERLNSVLSKRKGYKVNETSLIREIY
jgi:hypothetical protein